MATNFIKNKNAKVLDNLLTEKKTILVDLQPFYQPFTYDNGYKIEVNNKIFCDKDPLVDELSYFEIDSTKYKILRILQYSSYYECYCYRCEVI